MRLSFIEPERTVHAKNRQPASYVRRSFTVRPGLKQAELRLTACGVYEAYLNGEKLGNQVLTPGYKDYKYRLQVQEYDITEDLTTGENVLAAVIGDGWYRGALGVGSNRNIYGKKLKFGAELTLTYQNGKTEVLNADPSFRCLQNGGLRENDLKVIEKFDASLISGEVGQQLVYTLKPGKQDYCPLVFHKRVPLRQGGELAGGRKTRELYVHCHLFRPQGDRDVHLFQ